MQLVYRYSFWVLWAAWLLYWLWAARNAKPAAREEGRAARLLHIAPLLLAVLLQSFPPRDLGLPSLLLFQPNQASFFIGLAVSLLGWGWTIWARVTLGGNWSGTVTVKHGHELIVSGPYRITRHPIYTGLLLAFLGGAAASAQAQSLLAVALAALAFRLKYRVEEAFMIETFGDAYRDYRKRVPALVPFQ
jgi:protein-S-isoprenylcysteine O-methyltransferase Ste14